MNAARLDALLYGMLAGRRERAAARWPEGLRWVETRSGRLRVLDSGGEGHPVVFAPDGPCVIEHYEQLRALLAPDFRVSVFDLPGFGFSPPRADYDHSLRSGGQAIAGLLETLALRDATLFVHGMRDVDPADPLLTADPELPVDLVWGEADRTHRSTQPEAIRRHAPQAGIHRVPEAGHYPDLEDPEAFARLLRSRVTPTPQ